MPLTAIPMAENPDGGLPASFSETVASVLRMRDRGLWLAVSAAHSSLPASVDCFCRFAKSKYVRAGRYELVRRNGCPPRAGIFA